ncbi:outer membrane lipase/esterase [Modicisalibacter ilicicola DSM 19980]|uniref:Outer membrane lipase/esterase n=1 Tax=Modicisalibacter ilicicola DSM 19980 TaxID=1121942 RepID=A0A1M4Z918_9GAMM|nr:autotransporter domain-containing SGNH/GDSL hydrolase family protein [Halomonas ilicicola]SHF14307.1 outer membrane lipase/esterase [Halomonas ilicicola DSM 19980]
MTTAFTCRLGRHCLLTLGLGLTALPAWAYSDLIVFGDSLSDSGQFPDVERIALGEPGNLRFTNRLGPNYQPPAPYGEVSTQRLANALELGPLLPSTSILREQLGLPDGNNYATGGYTTGDILASITQPDGSVVDAGLVSRTRDGYLVSVGAADPDALYYLNGGGNDFLDGLIVDPASAAASANTLADGVEALVAAGAQTLVVSNVPDVGATPAGLLSGQRQAFSALGGGFNQALGERLARFDGQVDIIRLDIGTLFEEVVAAPADFGLATDVALTDVCFSDPRCASSAHGLTSANPDPDKLLFNDTVHPTTAGQQIVADYAYALVEAPQILSLAGELTLGALDAQQRAIGNELRPGLQSDELRVFVQGDYRGDRPDTFDADGLPESSQGGVGIGAVIPVGRGWLGAAVAQRAAQMDEPGEFDLEGQAFSVLARQHLGRLGVQTIVSGGDFDLDLRRQVTLGKAERSLKGDADTGGWAAELRLDYRLTAEDSAWYTAPFVAYRHLEAEVDGYTEEGSKANALVVADQDLEDRQLELGLMLDRGLEGGVGFYGEFAWGQYLEDEREGAEVRLASLPTNSWSGETREREDDNYLRADAGLRVQLGEARLSLGGGAQGWGGEWSPHLHVGAGFTF